MTLRDDRVFRTILRQILASVRRVPGALEEATRGRRTRRGEFGAFHEHRRYTRGEDVRRVDWNVYARTGELFLKLFEAEEHRRLTLALDLSASMDSGTPSRLSAARRLAAVLGALSLARLDGLRLILYPAAGGCRVTLLSGLPRLGELLETLDAFAPVGEAAPDAVAAAVLAAGAPPWLVWISDFHPLEDYARPLLRLSGARVSVRGLLPLVAEDEQVAAAGWLRVRDPESRQEDSFRADAALAREVMVELRLWREQLSGLFARTGHRLVLHRVPDLALPQAARWLPAL